MPRTASVVRATVPILLLCTLSPPARGQTSETLAGTSHDFTDITGSDDEGCVMCHLPFGTSGNKGGADEPVVYGSVLEVDGAETMGTETALCLSCHDGVSGPSVGGFDGSHPVSVAYDASAMPGLRPAAEVEERGLRLVTGDGGVRVECTSCHNAHDNTGGSFLRISNEGSAICLACHIK